eukprot:TRINITY_DN3095_c0_g2_i10.p1 TRINITY_DN3095_c0_g2~~TRINITY_DN3095_c0_g2_i10.p1  ORF type:complete len:248 (+),score=39.09 TRINITY_DN3095_c0_g2_i10:671-1414(+)
MYHNCASGPVGFEQECRMDEYTNTLGYYNIYPSGTIRGLHGWNTGVSTNCAANVNDVHFTREVLLYALENLCIDHTRIFGGGYANGVSMIYNISCELPNYFRGFGGVGKYPSNVWYPKACGVAAKPFMTFCGALNDVCSPDIENWLTTYSAAANCSDPVKVVQETPTTTCYSHENCTTGPVKTCKISDMAVCWPGIDSPVDYQCANQNPDDINGSEALLKFWDSLKADPSTPSREEMIASLKAELEK